MCRATPQSHRESDRPARMAAQLRVRPTVTVSDTGGRHREIGQGRPGRTRGFASAEGDDGLAEGKAVALADVCVDQLCSPRSSGWPPGRIWGRLVRTVPGRPGACYRIRSVLGTSSGGREAVQGEHLLRPPRATSGVEAEPGRRHGHPTGQGAQREGPDRVSPGAVARSSRRPSRLVSVRTSADCGSVEGLFDLRPLGGDPRWLTAGGCKVGT
jgi:hypothetical protein